MRETSLIDFRHEYIAASRPILPSDAPIQVLSLWERFKQALGESPVETLFTSINDLVCLKCGETRRVIVSSHLDDGFASWNLIRAYGGGVFETLTDGIDFCTRYDRCLVGRVGDRRPSCETPREYQVSSENLSSRSDVRKVHIHQDTSTDR